MASAARLGASRGLADAAAAQKVRLARNNAKFQAVKAAASMGMSNLASGGSFSSGVSQAIDPETGKLGSARTNFFGFPKMDTFKLYSD